MDIGRGMQEVRTFGLLLIALSLVSLSPAATVRKLGKDAETAKTISGYGSLPLSFEENLGQTDPAVRFLSRGSGYTLFLTEKDAVLSLVSSDKDREARNTAVRMSFAGASANTKVTAAGVQPNQTTYLSGKASQSRTGIRNYARVAYNNLYRGIDAVFYGNQRQLEYDFIVSPGADPRQIRLAFEGIGGLTVADDGNLVIRTSLGDIRQLRPVAYQTVNGRRRTVDARYAVHDGEVHFEIARYDHKKPLIIDPVLLWSTHLGETGLDQANAIAIDSAGAAYVVGYTASANFPAVYRFTSVPRGGASDAFITKYTTAGVVVYSTFIAGDGNDQALSVAVDSTGAAYVCGLTDSVRFPLVTPFQNIIGGGTDGFVLKLTPPGDQLVFSTYFGGFGNDSVNDIKVDPAFNVTFAGTTASSNIISNAIYQGGVSDGFLFRLNPTGTVRIYGTYVGTQNTDVINAVALDPAGDAYVTGRTNSVFLNATPGVFQPSIAAPNQFDAIVAKYNGNGVRVYATYLGGTAYDEGLSIAVDVAFNAFVFGVTDSFNFPLTSPIRPNNAGNRDAFLTKITPTANVRVFSTFIGGSGAESADQVVVNPNTGVAFLTGSTTSLDFPVVNATQSVNNGLTDGFYVQVNTPGTAFTTSSYIGGTGDDTATGIAVDAANNIYLTGNTQSFNFPVLNAVQAALSGGQDAFVLKFSNCTATLAPLLSGSPGAAAPFGVFIGAVSVTAATDCSYTAQSNDAFIVLSGATSGTGNSVINYTVLANTGPARSGTLSIGGQTFTIQQAAAPISGGGCIYPISSTSLVDQAPAQGALRNFQVGTSTNNCPYTVVSSVPWIQVFPTSGTSTQTINYTVFPNFGSIPRVGFINVNNQFITVTQSTAALSEVQRFVTLLYFNFLGRYPTQPEIDFQTGAILTGTARVDIAQNFFNSPEFNGGGRFIAGLYVGLLRRNAEFNGWLFQRNALATGVVTQDSLVSNFLTSSEFVLQNPSLNDTQFVTLLYQQVLLRNPSPAEVAFYVNALVTGTSRVALATTFLNSPEFRLGTSSQLTAFLFHSTLLGRDPAPAEQLFRQTQLNTGTPVRTILSDFLASPEFTNQLL